MNEYVSAALADIEIDGLHESVAFGRPISRIFGIDVERSEAEGAMVPCGSLRMGSNVFPAFRTGKGFVFHYERHVSDEDIYENFRMSAIRFA